MQRVSVVGNSGAGKTTLGRALAAELAVPFVELDSIYHQPGWQPLDRAEFQSRVGELAAGEGWIIDGNYSAVRELVWARADTVIWFDLPRSLVMRQILWRTLSRSITRQELWNGNREPLRNWLRWSPEESVVRWAWVSHAKYQQRYGAAAADPGHLNFVRLTSRADGQRFLQGVAPR